MTNDKVEVSVLITFYNQEKYVNKTIESVINQKVNFPFLIVIGDDGSTDATFEIANQWVRKYPNLIHLYRFERDDKNYIGGFRASQNRLKLLKVVNSNYFIFLDGDDYYIDDSKLQKQYDILNNPANYDCVACGHNMLMRFDDGKELKTTSNKLHECKIKAKEYWGKYYIHTDALMFRSEIIQNIDFGLVQNNYNDNMITFLAIRYGEIYYIPDEMAVYYQSDDGIWTGNKKITNHIRNMFLYDLCNIINPEFYKETNRRFAYSWYYIFKNRKKLVFDSPLELLDEAKNRNLKYSLMWLSYKKLSMIDKIKICCKSLIDIRWLVLDRLFCH